MDEPSQQQISNLFENLSDIEKAIYDDIDLQCVRLLTYSLAIREWTHEHDGTQVTLTGDIVEPDRFGKLRAFNFLPEEVVPAITEKEHALESLDLDQNAWTPSTTPDRINEELPESFETAGKIPVRASFQTPASIRYFNNCDEMELTGEYDEEWLCDHVGQTVSVQGYRWHAHTGHQHTPVMMDTDPWFK